MPSQTEATEEVTFPREVAIRQLTLGISLDDVLEKPSALNPHPEKAKEGLEIWTIFHPTSNPQVNIRYLGTGEMYQVSIPISYEQPQISPKKLDTPPRPIIDEEGNSHGRWIPLEEWWPEICEMMLDQELEEDINPYLEEAISSRKTEDGAYIVEAPTIAFFNIMKKALEEARRGLWKEAIAIAEYGPRVGSYKLHGVTLTQEQVGIFDYANYGLAADIFPTLARKYPNKNLIGGELHPFNLSRRIITLIVSSVKIMALQKAIEGEQNDIVKRNLNHVLELTRATYSTVTEDLEAMRLEEDEKSLLERIRAYLKERGIELL